MGLDKMEGEALRPLLGGWGLPADARLERLCESENATWLAMASDGKRAVLRVHRPGYNDAAEIRSEHSWINALREAGTIETPAVLERHDGSTLASIGERHVAAFAFMAGSEPVVGGDLPTWFERLGGLTARLHRQAREWHKPSGFKRKIWTFETTLGDRPHWGDWRNSLGLDEAGRCVLGQAVEAIGEELAAYGADPDRFGLIHADLRLANLLVEHERLGVIDFDDCGFGYFMYDFAASISFIEHDEIVDELRKAWISGYRAVAPLNAQNEAILPVFTMLRRILLTAWIASRPEADPAKVFGSAFTDGTVELAQRFLSRS